MNGEDLTQMDAGATQTELPTEAPSTRSRKAGRRSRLTQDQQHEIARVYAETVASTAQIRQRFGIGESSLYRLLQKQGVPLRGRAVQAPDSSIVSVKRDGEAQQVARKRMSISRDGLQASRARAPRIGARNSNGAEGQFRIEFRTERVYEAADIRDALRQAEASGMTDIVEITRAF
jgi:hypothetical protein